MIQFCIACQIFQRNLQNSKIYGGHLRNSLDACNSRYTTFLNMPQIMTNMQNDVILYLDGNYSF